MCTFEMSSVVEVHHSVNDCLVAKVYRQIIQNNRYDLRTVRIVKSLVFGFSHIVQTFIFGLDLCVVVVVLCVRYCCYSCYPQFVIIRQTQCNNNGKCVSSIVRIPHSLIWVSKFNMQLSKGLSVIDKRNLEFLKANEAQLVHWINLIVQRLRKDTFLVYGRTNSIFCFCCYFVCIVVSKRSHKPSVNVWFSVRN